MKRRFEMIKSLIRSVLAICIGLTLLSTSALAQRGNTNVKTDSRILYHNGPVMQGSSNVYLIWYGNWAGNTATTILTELVIGLGTSAYFQINTQYPDALGNAPNGGLIYSGTVSDSYSHGAELTRPDIQDLVLDMIAGGHLPLDGAGIYIVLSTADVIDIQPDGSSFCLRKFPHHGMINFNGAQVKYGYLGNPDRCPSTVPHPNEPASAQLTTPNGNFGADAMASQLAHLLNVIVTSPMGSGGESGGWYDRYGFENAAKCWGTFGQTYQAPNGGTANIRLGIRDFLIQQNWVNGRKGFCAMSAPAQ
jgi:phosphate-induced protein 1